MTAVVEQGVHGFLQHAFFVADDDFRRLELEEGLEPVVPVDDAAIQVVQIRRGKPSAFERHERAQVRRNHRQHRKNHPFRTALGNLQALEQFDPLRQFFADLFALGFGHRLLQLIDALGQVHPRQRFAHGFRAHLGQKRVRAVGLAGFAVFVFVEQLILFQRRVARINDEVILVINHALQVARGHVEDEADARRHAFEKPDVARGHGQFDVAHALAADAGERHFHAATVADDAAMLDALVLAAGTFPVLDGAENAFAEEAALLRLERTVVDGFRIFDFAFAPRPDGLG